MTPLPIMAQTPPHMPSVRRLEAVGARSWPASHTEFDGAWALRLTAAYPSKRLNSVTPLDRYDNDDLDERINRLKKRFDDFGRPLVFRTSPLTPTGLVSRLEGWRHFDESIVMVLNLEEADLDDAVSHLPLRDTGRWIDQSIAMGGAEAHNKPGLAELMQRIQGETNFLLNETPDGEPLSAALTVRFGDLVGLFMMRTNPAHRGKGFGRDLLKTALLRGREQGAQQAWLQVVSDNEAALGLYKSAGFREVYRYCYAQAPEGSGS